MAHGPVFSLGLLVSVLCVHAASVQRQQDLLQVTASQYTAQAEADRVTDLPGLGKPKFGLFSG